MIKSKEQVLVLQKMIKGVRYSAFELKCSIATLNALCKLKQVKCVNHGQFGSVFMSRIILQYVKIK